jgi:hypothetical protein
MCSKNQLDRSKEKQRKEEIPMDLPSSALVTPEEEEPDEIDDEPWNDTGQTTAEYALVLLGVAAIAAVLIKWATSASGLTRLFTAVLRKLVQGVGGVGG